VKCVHPPTSDILNEYGMLQYSNAADWPDDDVGIFQIPTELLTGSDAACR